MEKIKRIVSTVFGVEFLLKVLLIVAIITLLKGEWRIVVFHSGSVSVSSEYGGFEIKKKE